MNLKFQCHLCNFVTDNQSKAHEHMKLMHKINTDEEESCELIACPHCSYSAMNMSIFKDHMINIHHKNPRDWGVGEVKLRYCCAICDEEFSSKDMLSSHVKKSHEDKEVVVNEEDKIILSMKSKFYEVKQFPENIENEDKFLDKVYGAKQKMEQQGITMKSKNQEFKDASTILKSKLLKGKTFKDEKGRHIKILNDAGNGELEVEV